jgi:hypothetical protein
MADASTRRSTRCSRGNDGVTFVGERQNRRGRTHKRGSEQTRLRCAQSRSESGCRPLGGGSEQRLAPA